MISEERKKIRQLPRLRVDRSTHDARGEGTYGGEAHLPEGEHARVPHEDVERDDERDGEQSILELERPGGGGETPEHSD